MKFNLVSFLYIARLKIEKMSLYPTPKQSPSPKLNLVWTVEESIEIPTSELVESSRKRKGVPMRSVSKPLDQIDRSFQRIITLDVYGMFKLNPSKLLNRKASFSDSDSEDHKSHSKVASTERKKSNVPSACKALPVFILENEPSTFDISSYMDTKGAIPVIWKGAQPLVISPTSPEYNKITAEEAKTCATLRILPTQYLEIKRTILTAVNCYGPFKKREAQTWFRIDVNKVKYH
jgi:hypothetical protein